MFGNSDTSRAILSVTKLNRLARNILESEIGQVWLMAEISNFTAASSGHWYFTLKDERAQIRSAMFRNANMRVKQRPREGDKVLVRGGISVYEARGDYQLIVDHLEPAGEGMLKQQFEQLKIKLAAEGLFAQQHKKALPEMIRRVGVITSSTGAALHDILTVLKRRSPMIEVVVYPSQVQGDSAAASLCEALATANARNEVDVLLLGRGGGSLEDLWCFNDERLARAIFASQLPIVSAVGHEVDVTIADFVADVRAPTPSAAAELVSTHQGELQQAIDNATQRLVQHFHNQLRYARQRADNLGQRLANLHPERQLLQQQQRIDQLQEALTTSVQRALQNAALRQQDSAARLTNASPDRRIQQQTARNQELYQRLQSGMNSQLKQAHQRLASNSQLLDTVSPLATLARGYSITLKDDSLIKHASDVQSGDVITTRLKEGEIKSTVC